MNNLTKEQIVANELGTVIANQAIDYASLRVQYQQLQDENKKLRQEIMVYQQKAKRKEVTTHESTSHNSSNGQNNH